MGEGPRGSIGTCSTLCWISVTPSATHNQTGPLWCWFLSGWACAHSRPLWVSPRNSPVRLGVSPADASTPTGVFNQRFEALFPHAGALGLHQLQPCPPRSTNCHLSGSASRCLAASPLFQAAVSAPPTGLDECVVFISLVVGLPYSLIFCQFWLFFVFKLLLSFFWLCKEGQCIYLCLHLGRKWLNVSLFGSDLFNLTMFKLSVFYLVLYCVFFKSIPRNLSASIVHVCLVQQP